MAKSNVRVTKTRTRKRQTNNLQQPWAKNPLTLWLVSGALLAAAILYAIVGRRQAASIKSTPSASVVRKPPPGRAWKLVDTEHGKGLVATRDLIPGDLIVIDLPLLQIPLSENRTESIESLLTNYVRLSEKDRADYLALSLQQDRLKENFTIADKVLNIFESNAVRSSSGQAIFKDSCRINHSCDPNADYFYRDDLEALVVHAVKPIKAGEQIFCPYFDAASHTYDERQGYLEHAYSFKCECPVCSLKDKERAESDARRARVAELRQIVVGWSEERVEAEEALAAIEEALTLLAEEGYQASLGSWSVNAMQIAAAHSSSELTKKYAAKAATRYAIETGSDSSQLAAIKTVEVDPTEAQAWGKREERNLDITHEELVEKAKAQREIRIKREAEEAEMERIEQEENERRLKLAKEEEAQAKAEQVAEEIVLEGDVNVEEEKETVKVEVPPSDAEATSAPDA